MRTPALIAVICFVGTIGLVADVAFAVERSLYAEFSSSSITAVGYCSNGRKIISQGCYMTENEAQGNALAQCQSREQIPLFTYRFSGIQECENFRKGYLQSLTAQAQIFERIASGQQEEEVELVISSTSSTKQKITPKEAKQQLDTAHCGCQEIVVYLANFLLKGDVKVATCEFVSDWVQKGLNLKVCGATNAMNFFLGKACSWGVKTGFGVVDEAFLRPMCDSLLDYVNQGFKLDLRMFSLQNFKTKGANLICSNLFSSSKQSNQYGRPGVEVKGIWRTALEYLGVCGSSALEILLRN